MAEHHFPYDLDLRFKPIWWPLGVRPRHGVTVDDDTVTATYGPFSLSTPRDNVRGAHLTEDYLWFKAIGVRLSLADSGLTFGTTDRRGACLHFKQPVGGVVPTRSHSALTATVADCAGLIQLLGLDEPQ